MSDGPYSHVAFVVADINEAIARFSAVFDLHFNEPREVFLEQMCDPEPRQATLKVAFSKEGPPHYELIEGDGRGIYAIPDGDQIHHVGLWQHDAEGRMHELARAGVRCAAFTRLQDGTILTWFNETADLHGVRFEFVDDADRPTYEHFMKTGEFPGEMNL